MEPLDRLNARFDPSAAPANAHLRFVGADGVWRQRLRSTALPGPGPALFLDRDGVIVEEVGHLCRPDDVRLVPGAAATIAAANRAAVFVIIVSNQSGIGRALFDWGDFAAVQERMMAMLLAAGAAIDAVFACPFHPEATPPWRHPDHPARKPNPGMLTAAGELLAVDLHRSWIIGDRASDTAAGRAAGLAGALHVKTGWGSAAGETAAALALAVPGAFPVLEADSIEAATRLLPLFR